MQLTTLFLALMTAQTALAALPLRLITWNIRYDAGSRESGEKPWWDLFCSITKTRCREYKAIDHLNDMVGKAPNGAAVVVGMQEVLNNQLKDIKSGLGSDWDHVGVGRDDGGTKGEYSPILYKPGVLKLLDSETKWLSPTPDQVSFGWGAGSRRVVTMAVFEHSATGTKFIHANCHLDNVSAQARSEGIKVVIDRINKARAKWGPISYTLSGDFNSSPNDGGFKTLADSGIMQGELYDLAQAGGKIAGSLTGTYTTFNPTDGGSRIDYLWLGPKDTTSHSVQKYEIMDSNRDGVLTSDHRAVVGDITIL